MTNAYAGFIPVFAFNTSATEAEAPGHFWDGRADTLALQALDPFLNPLKMSNADRKAVFDKVAASSYAPLHEDLRDASDRAIDSHIKNLRRKLEQASAGDIGIASVYGVGYRFDLTT